MLSCVGIRASASEQKGFELRETRARGKQTKNPEKNERKALTDSVRELLERPAFLSRASRYEGGQVEPGSRGIVAQSGDGERRRRRKRLTPLTTARRGEERRRSSKRGGRRRRARGAPCAAQRRLCCSRCPRSSRDRNLHSEELLRAVKRKGEKITRNGKCWKSPRRTVRGNELAGT